MTATENTEIREVQSMIVVGIEIGIVTVDGAVVVEAVVAGGIIVNP
jgi:hypothetical protein